MSARQTAPAGEVVLRAADAPVRSVAWVVRSDAAASGGAALALPDAGVPKLASASSNPRDFFEMTFYAKAGVPYRLWLRSRAERDSWANDSAFVQFSNSVTSTGAAAFRIGTTSATVVSLEDCSGCGVSGWGWSDNGYASDGALIYFAADGEQTVRIQGREDGYIIDEIVLSPQKYLDSAPGTGKQDTTTLPVSDGSAPAPAPGVTMVRGPYLQQPSDRSMTVVWATREAGTAEVRYQTPGGTLSAAGASRLVRNSETALGYDYYQHEATITGLAAATAYTYQPFVGAAAAGDAATFRTLPSRGTGSISFIAFGDSGTGSVEQRQLAALMARENVDLALHAGDIVYGTSATTGDATYTSYQKWLFGVYPWLSTIPFVPTEGNHDSNASNGDGRAYRDLFVLPENGAIAERYYSFDAGPVHFIVLDTEYAFQDTTRRAEQLAWAESDLSTTSQPWKVALFHRSPYSSGAEHGSELTVRAAFGPVFERYGVDVALSGHDHDYERTVPIRQSSVATDRPVTYVVTGGGGAKLYSVSPNSWTAFTASRFEYVRGRVDACTLVIEGIGLDGAAFDRASLSRCGTQPQGKEIALYAGQGTTAGEWRVQADATAAGGSFAIHPNGSAPKVATAAASPLNYVDLSFNAVAGVPYRLWIRSRAQNNYYGNDSVFVQFSGSVSASGAPVWRIGSINATTVILEDCSGCPMQGWGWQDNGYASAGPLVYFADSGTQRLRIQTREDGLGIDQVVLSPARYLSSSPGRTTNDTVILTQSGGQ